MGDCLFCRISAGDIPADVVYQDEVSLAFQDIQPQAPVHLLVIPRRHIESLAAVDADETQLLGHLNLVASRVARDAGIAESGFRTVVNSGSDAHQTVPHLHIHVLGRRKFSWPPG